jgi:tyrosyl-tRNA synthetase
LDITTRTHGATAADQAIADAAVKFSGETIADPDALASLYASSGGFTFAAGADVISILADAGHVTSRGEGRRLVQGGGLTINGVRVTDVAFVPEPIAGEWLDVRIGKRRREIGRRVE